LRGALGTKQARPLSVALAWWRKLESTTARWLAGFRTALFACLLLMLCRYTSLGDKDVKKRRNFLLPLLLLSLL